ncbi:hypothetical protein BDP27DRAFT_1331943 [Rhodocollybia butyracea]|uniref:Uncharacterized protein n=1 Tax=Rhodocollybia butyracea TaxID=206335 RepID=A0A9P5PHJ9_9AGAR|nr:hypothetical protein BDP27DRAFT_1331943 [Rhodocollybia butyracea]
MVTFEFQRLFQEKSPTSEQHTLAFSKIVTLEKKNLLQQALKHLRLTLPSCPRAKPASRNLTPDHFLREAGAKSQRPKKSQSVKKALPQTYLASPSSCSFESGSMASSSPTAWSRRETVSPDSAASRERIIRASPYPSLPSSILMPSPASSSKVALEDFDQMLERGFDGTGWVTENDWTRSSAIFEYPAYYGLPQVEGSSLELLGFEIYSPKPLLWNGGMAEADCSGRKPNFRVGSPSISESLGLEIHRPPNPLSCSLVEPGMDYSSWRRETDVSNSARAVQPLLPSALPSAAKDDQWWLELERAITPRLHNVQIVPE